LGDLAGDRPKSMVEIQGKPFLRYQLEGLRRGEIKNIVLCVGHMGEQIERYFGNGREYGINIKYSYEDSPLGTAGALKQAESLLDDTFFAIYGDSYLFLDFKCIMAYFTQHSKLALMTVYRNCDRYDLSNTSMEDNLVRRYGKQERSEDMVYIDYGANILRKDALGMVSEGRFYPLEDLFPRLIEREELLAYEVKERFYEIGSRQGLSDFKQYIEGAG